MVAVCMVTIMVGLLSADCIVATATSTMQQIQQQEQQKNELENQLSQTQENLEDLKGEHSTLKGELNNLNTQLTEVSENLASLEQQIADKEQEISDTQESLAEAKATESWQYDSMVIRVQSMYEMNESSYVNAILSKGSFDEMLNAADFFEQIAAYDKLKLEEFKENRRLIEEQEACLQNEKIELDNLLVAAEAEKSKVSGLISQTSNTMAQYAEQISDAEQQALAYEAEIKKAEENLDTLRKKLAEEMALSQTAANSTWRDISEVSFAEGDRYLLANLIYCEAGGEPYAGQVAVGSVVINRVLSSVFPDTVVGVIYQRRQFSPVASGRLELALGANKATESCYRAADEAMSGVTNVGNCVFFRTPIEGLTGINIGGHVFY
ncbi:MAG: cell wall hydrolase [Lachnospiraceae bacterium]|nr:cell wall hydrolase [Lachnospiraceae bacterium]